MIGPWFDYHYRTNDSLAMGWGIHGWILLSRIYLYDNRDFYVWCCLLFCNLLLCPMRVTSWLFRRQVDQAQTCSMVWTTAKVLWVSGTRCRKRRHGTHAVPGTVPAGWPRST